MPASTQPRVLLGSLEPVVRLGMTAVLGELGVEIVGQEDRPAALLLMAGRLQPDAVVLDHGSPGARALGDRVRAAAPAATVILWARDEDVMEVLDPGSPAPRRFESELPDQLRGELLAAVRPSIPQVEE